MTRKGYGEFTVPVKIYYKRELKKEPTVQDHTLNFDERITYRGFIEEFDAALLSQLMKSGATSSTATTGRGGSSSGAGAGAGAGAGVSRRSTSPTRSRFR